MEAVVPDRIAERAPADPVESLRADARALDALVEEVGAGAGAAVDEVLARARRAGDGEALAWALRAQAIVRRHTDDLPGAVRSISRAQRAARAAGADVAEVWVVASRAVLELVRGRTSRARADAELALSLAHRAEADQVAEVRARVHLVLAVIEHNSGRLQQAETWYRALLAEVPPRGPNAVRAANNLALVLAARGRFADALGWAERAVDAAAGASAALRPWPYLTRALIEVRTGRLGDGLRDLERAALSCEEAGLSPGEYYVEYADTMRELRLLPEAVEAGARAVAELERTGDRLVEAEARVSLAETLLMAGDLASAARAADAVRALARRQRRAAIHDRAVVAGAEARRRAARQVPADRAAVRRAAGRLSASGQVEAAVGAYLVAGRLADPAARVAGPLYDAAARLARRGSVTIRVRGRVAAARAALVRGDDDGVLAACRSGLRDLARHRETLPTTELRALASGHGAELGELGLEVLLRRSSAAAVLRWMEGTRAAALLAPEPVRPGAGEHRGRRAHPAPLVGAARGAAAVLDDDPPGAARRSDWLAPGADPRDRQVHRPAGVARLAEALAGRVLVEYGLCGDRLVAVVVEGRRPRVVELGRAGLLSGDLRALVFALRRLVDPRSPAAAEAARASADHSLARLRRALVEPLGVAGHAEVVVVPVGLLHGVPWSALHDGPVSIAPSATAWVRTSRSRPDAERSVVLVAGPGLTGAQHEVDVLRRMHPGADVLGAGASRGAAVLEALGRADLAHLACHGTLRSDNPMFSSVELADGPLTVHDLHRAGAAPRRLVLASCHSGADVAYEGDEVLGLVSAMLARGTTGVVASIAAVPDVEVVDLMVALHRRLAAGETMARALHGARAEIDRGTPAGFVNWCTFGAHGAG